jgi:hypothetical protein
MVWAKPREPAKAIKNIRLTIRAAGNLMGPKFCHQALGLASEADKLVGLACLYPFSP